LLTDPDDGNTAMPEVAIPLHSARPALAIDGRPADDLAAALNDLRVENRSDGLAHSELTFGNWGLRNGVNDYTLFTRQRLDFGKRLDRQARPTSAFSPAGSWRSKAVFRTAAFPAFAVFAEDRLQDLRMKRRSRVASSSRAMPRSRASIAGEHGLQAAIDLPGPTHALLAQVNQSDLAFLRQRALAARRRAVAGQTTPCTSRRRPARAGASPVELAYGSDTARLRRARRPRPAAQPADGQRLGCAADKQAISRSPLTASLLER
jgi:hypothetical protein